MVTFAGMAWSGPPAINKVIQSGFNPVPLFSISIRDVLDVSQPSCVSTDSLIESGRRDSIRRSLQEHLLVSLPHERGIDQATEQECIIPNNKTRTHIAGTTSNTIDTPDTFQHSQPTNLRQYS